MIRWNLIKFLKEQTDVAAIVGERIDALVFLLDAPLPYLTLEIIAGTERERSQDGASGLVNATVQVRGYGKSLSQAERMMNAVRLSLDDRDREWIGAAAAEEADNTFVQTLELADEFDEFNEDTQRFSIVQEYQISYEEAVRAS